MPPCRLTKASVAGHGPGNMARVDTIEAAREAHQASGEKLAHALGHIFRLVVLAIGLALVVRTFVVQPFSIPSRSMAPLLDAGDFLFVNKSAYGWSRASVPFFLVEDGIPETGTRSSGRFMGRQPDLGDVIVFASANHRTPDYVKRVIARGGDRVALEGGRIVLNGLPVPCTPQGNDLCREQLPNGASYSIIDDRHGPLADFGEIIVPAGHVFVLGDNRGDSIDSRVSVTAGGIGLVHESQIIGKGARIFFSLASGDKSGGLIRWDRIGQAIE